MVDLSIIIVSWNVRELLEKCLASIARPRDNLTPPLSYKEREISFEVFVVDNASTDGTADFVRNFQFPISNFQYILNSSNLGFAYANNQGIREAKGRYMLLLNPDTEVQPHLSPLLKGEEEYVDPLLVGEGSPPASEFARRRSRAGVRSSLEAMINFMDTHPRCGILGPRLVNTDWSHQPSVRRFPDAWSPTFLSLGFKTRSVRQYLAEDMDYGRAQIVDQVMGAAFMIRREVIDAIGLLDERYFIWFEEVDYCKRAKDAEWEVWYTPDAAITHHGGQSFAQALTLRKQWWFSRSMLHYFWKHGQWGAFLLNIFFWPIRLLYALVLFH